MWCGLSRGSSSFQLPSNSPVSASTRTSVGFMRSRLRLLPSGVRGMPPLAMISLPASSTRIWCGSMPCVRRSATLRSVRVSRTLTQPSPVRRSVSPVYCHCPSRLGITWPSSVRASPSSAIVTRFTTRPSASMRSSQVPGRAATARKPPPASGTTACGRVGTGTADCTAISARCQSTRKAPTWWPASFMRQPPATRVADAPLAKTAGGSEAAPRAAQSWLRKWRRSEKRCVVMVSAGDGSRPYDASTANDSH